MITVLDPTYVGKALGEFVVDKKDLTGFDYKSHNLRMKDFKNVNPDAKVEVRTNGVYKISFNVSENSHVYYDSEYSYIASDGDIVTKVTFNCEFSNPDVEQWKSKDATTNFIGKCYKDGNIAVCIKSLSEYQCDFPNYQFDAIELDTRYNTITHRLAVFDMYELINMESKFEFISKNDFNDALHTVYTNNLI